MSVHQRRLKIVNFTLNGVAYDCQVTSWKLSYGIKTGTRIYTYCAAGEGNNDFIEETDGEPSLELKHISDWTSGGISDFLINNSMTVATFQLDHHPDIVGEHVRWSGSVQIQAPDIGGDARVTEIGDVTMPIIGAVPTYARMG
jgi:hypothetical protein